jgi:hypothetical protein
MITEWSVSFLSRTESLSDSPILTPLTLMLLYVLNFILFLLHFFLLQFLYMLAIPLRTFHTLYSPLECQILLCACGFVESAAWYAMTSIKAALATFMHVALMSKTMIWPFFLLIPLLRSLTIYPCEEIPVPFV